MNILTILNLSFLKIIHITIIIIGAIASIKIIEILLNRIKRFNKNITLIYALKDLFKYIIYIIALILIFDVMNIDLKGIFISIGIVGIVVGFAAKDMISNFMSGFFLISDKTLQVGDIMSTDNLKGEILKINFRNITIKDENGVISTIPNSSLTNNPYSKFKKNEQLKVKLTIVIPLKINSKDFEEKILKKISKKPYIKINPFPYFTSDFITSEGIYLNLIFWVKDINKKEEYKLNIMNEIQNYLGEIT